MRFSARLHSAVSAPGGGNRHRRALRRRTAHTSTRSMASLQKKKKRNDVVKLAWILKWPACGEREQSGLKQMFKFLIIKLGGQRTYETPVTRYTQGVFIKTDFHTWAAMRRSPSSEGDNIATFLLTLWGHGHPLLLTQRPLKSHNRVRYQEQQNICLGK